MIRTTIRKENIGERNFKKHFEFHNGKIEEHEFGCFYTMSIHKNHVKKQKYGTESV